MKIAREIRKDCRCASISGDKVEVRKIGSTKYCIASDTKRSSPANATTADTTSKKDKFWLPSESSRAHAVSGKNANASLVKYAYS